ncbi:hypothetical protein DL96DRAFT_1681866 [Flagelloscypha sp. PMI_526]|nr:hypothetical protein DL96DRAFT_1681866 [Flagelloscypha sp. PMI_526]
MTFSKHSVIQRKQGRDEEATKASLRNPAENNDGHSFLSFVPQYSKLYDVLPDSAARS